MPFAQRNLHLFPDKKERKRALSRLDLSLWRRVCAIVGKPSLPTRLPAAMSAPWTITGRSCFPSGDAAFIKKRSKVIHPGGCRLYPGTVAPGEWTVCGGVRCNHKIPFGIRAVFYLLPHSPPYRQGPGLAGLSARGDCRCFEDINDHPLTGCPEFSMSLSRVITDSGFFYAMNAERSDGNGRFSY